MLRPILPLASVLALAPAALGPIDADATELNPVDSCIGQLRQVVGADAGNVGQVIGTEFSEDGTVILLRDPDGTIWRCIGRADGSVGDLTVAEPNDGAAPTIPNEPTTTTQQVAFPLGTLGAEIAGSLTPGGSARYALEARGGQILEVRVDPEGPSLEYQIFNPDETFLLEMTSSDLQYRGQLLQSGNHIVEVINRGSAAVGYRVGFSIE